jgi:hypothetical protein
MKDIHMRSMIFLALLGSTSCVVDQLCTTDDNCPDAKVCTDGKCVASEGEGERDVGSEGEGDIASEGEGDIGSEGEGDIGSEGEGDIGSEGEGEGIACPRVTFACGNNVAGDFDEECDDGARQGGDSCDVNCKNEVPRCGVMVPPAFASAGVVVAQDAAQGTGCFTSLTDALLTSPADLYVAPGTYADEAWPLTFNLHVVGASAGQVIIGPIESSDETVVITDDALIEHVTVRGVPNAVVRVSGGAVRFENVVLLGNDLVVQQLVVISGGASFQIEQSKIASGSLFMTSDASNTDLLIFNSEFRRGSLSVFGAASVVIQGSCFDLVQNNNPTIDAGPEKSVDIDNNTIGGDACLPGPFESKRPLRLEDGVFSLSRNHFLARPNCTAISVSSAADQVPSVIDWGLFGTNVFDPVSSGTQIDLDVQKPINISATQTDWSNENDRCANIRLVAGASVTAGNGITCAP